MPHSRESAGNRGREGESGEAQCYAGVSVQLVLNEAEVCSEDTHTVHTDRTALSRIRIKEKPIINRQRFTHTDNTHTNTHLGSLQQKGFRCEGPPQKC